MNGHALNVFGVTTPIVPIATPEVAWSGLAPVVVLLVGGILLLTIASLTPKGPQTRWYAPYTVVVALIAAVSAVPLWARVQGSDFLESRH